MNVNKLPGSKVQFEVVIPVELFKKAVDDAFEKKIKTVEVKGFRKGQAPRNVYEAQYGVESLYEDALNSAISETYYEAVRDNKIDVCGYPKIDVDTRKINPEEPIHYFVTVSVTPEVTLGEYKGLQIVKETVKVSKKEVEDDIKAALERDAMMATKEDGIIEKGNTAKFDFEGKVDGVAFEGGTAKDYELEIGSGQFIPGFEDQMVGMKVGETKDINVTFPEDYHAENLKGKAAVFTVSVKEVKVKELPELTVEWCNEQKHNHDGKELKFETVEDYKNHIKEHIKEHKEEHAKAEAQNKLFETVIANAKFELPEDLVEEDVESEFKNAEAQAKQYNMPLEMLLMYTGGGTVEQFRENLKKQATQRLSLRFVLKAIAEKENFEVTEEEINKEYQDLAEHYKMTEEQVRQAVDAESIKEEIKSQKAYKLIEDANPFVAPQKK